MREFVNSLGKGGRGEVGGEERVEEIWEGVGVLDNEFGILE